MRASVVLEKASNYEILGLQGNTDGAEESQKEKRNSLLVLHKVTETGAPFLVVAGYFLSEVGKFDDESLLAEIETVPESEYSRLKGVIRQKKASNAPITFW
ncbi:MAG: hypothetical protein ACREBS_03510 [Nitrososphaerales archaeon]